MTRQEKTERLAQYAEAARREKRLREELRRWRETGEQMHAALDGMPRARRGGSRVEAAAVRVADLEAALCEEMGRLANERLEVLNAVRTVDGEGLRHLLELRYIDGLTFEKIAEKTSYSVRQTLRRHALALDELKWEDAS